METNPTPRTGPASPLAELAAVADQLLALHDQLLRALVAADAWGGMPGAVGMASVDYLALVKRLPRQFVRRVESVATRLSAMPACAEVWQQGLVTFDELALLVRAASTWNGEGLALLDDELACLAADLADEHRLSDLEWEVDLRVQRLRAPGWAQRPERRAAAGRQVNVQMDFDGGGLVVASLDAVGFATVVGSIQAFTGPPTKGIARRTQRADALVALCEVAMGDGAGAKGRPTLHVVVDLQTATTDRFGQLLTASGGRAIPTISARLADCLAEHAQLLVQITNGRNPLAELRAADTPAAVRRATLVRDRGSRWPGDTAPALETQVHHNNGRNDRGEHPIGQLTMLPLRRHQLTVHANGWQVAVDEVTALAAFVHEKSGIRLATMPRGTAPPWDWRTWPGSLPDWLAPPIPPPPTHPPPDVLGPADGRPPDDRPPDLDALLAVGNRSH